MSRPSIVLDDVSKKMIRVLQEDCTLPHVRLWQRLGIKRTTFSHRLRILRDQGVILGYRAIVDPEKVGLEITALLHVGFDGRRAKDIEKFQTRLRVCPHVLDCYEMASDGGYTLKIVAANLGELKKVVDELIWDVACTMRLDIATRTIKMGAIVPIR